MMKSLLTALPLICALTACLPERAAITAPQPVEAVSYHQTAPTEQRQQTGAFAVQMFRTQAAQHEGNFVFSPASLEGVLHSLKQGASGTTTAELNALSMGITEKP